MNIAKILGIITPESKAKIKTSLEGVKTELPFLISLTNEARKKLRTVGPIRNGYVKEVNLASNANRSALAEDFKLDDYNTKLALHTALSEIYSLANPLMDSIESTLMALGAELMKETDEAYDYLKIAAKKENNQNLNTTIQKIMNILKHEKKQAKKS